ncbi:hypothetical protein [Blastococcus saxobsidens]|uniref:hypothetical protein n=1 Tax=Blastococcus saxobsidens TaxID=138336 RepID=UPI00030AE40D|nr:hypothetical protein [Blastococcus saxobsidens]
MTGLWIVGGLAGWFLLAAAVAVVIGRGIRVADQRELRSGVPQTTALAAQSLPGGSVAGGSARTQLRRRTSAGQPNASA